MVAELEKPQRQAKENYSCRQAGKGGSTRTARPALSATGRRGQRGVAAGKGALLCVEAIDAVLVAADDVAALLNQPAVAAAGGGMDESMRAGMPAAGVRCGRGY